MTAAQEVYAIVSRPTVTAVTLQGGYALFSAAKRELFEPCHVECVKFNKQPRVTYLRARYADGSRLEFRWNPAPLPRPATDRLGHYPLIIR